MESESLNPKGTKRFILKELHLYLLPPMLPCGQPFMSGEPWKAAFPWPCCIIGDCVWAMRGESMGLCGAPGPPKPPSPCWLIPVVDASGQVNQTGPAETRLQTNVLSRLNVSIHCKLQKHATWRQTFCSENMPSVRYSEVCFFWYHFLFLPRRSPSHMGAAREGIGSSKNGGAWPGGLHPEPQQERSWQNKSCIE